MKRFSALAGLALFILLATANSGGYRYGAGDQAFYQPAVEWRLHPELFPRDRALLASQSRLTLVDETLAAASRLSGADVPSLFLILYVGSLVLLYFGAGHLARLAGASSIATATFLAVLTLRHRIAKTGANTLEGYMHPRVLAFAIGLFGFTAVVGRRWMMAALLFVAAAAVHPTTAVWWLAAAVGALVLPSPGRREAWALAGLAAACVLAVVLHRLSPWHLPLPDVMDDQWLAVLSAKDYLFVSTWPAYAWVANLAYLPTLWWLIARRRAAGRGAPIDAAVLAGAITLFACFAVSQVLAEAHVALAVQLQVSRVFWMLDLLVALYLCAWLVDVVLAGRSRGVAVSLAAAAVAIAAARGVYTLRLSGRQSPLFQTHLPDDEWQQAMTWLRRQPVDWLVLADPDHAWKFGTSVRVAASRDVVFEGVKDTAIAMYNRDAAMRVAERSRALQSFASLDAASARALGRQYGATVLVEPTGPPLALPRLYVNAGFVIYDLR